VAPPPVPIIEEELSLEEIIIRASGDIEQLKAIADITVTKYDKPYDVVSASLLIKKPGWVHMRVYKFGMLVKDFVFRDGELYVLSGKINKNIKQLGNEFYGSIFWWDNMKDGVMLVDEDKYIITSENRQVHLDKSTLVPLKQMINLEKRRIEIIYGEALQNKEGFRYPSTMQVQIGALYFSIKIKKLLSNPSLGINDFRTPSGS
jgi:hypothetical protein